MRPDVLHVANERALGRVGPGRIHKFTVREVGQSGGAQRVGAGPGQAQAGPHLVFALQGAAVQALLLQARTVAHGHVAGLAHIIGFDAAVLDFVEAQTQPVKADLVTGPQAVIEPNLGAAPALQRRGLPPLELIE